MISSTEASVLVEYGRPPEVRQIPVPELLPGSLLVEVAVSTVCGTDVHIADGHLSFAARPPLILGHEVIGRVADGRRDTDALGEPLGAGDLVAWAYAWCGHCYWCSMAKEPTLCPNARRYGWGPADEFPNLTGGFAKHAYVLPQCAVLKVPDGIDIRLAASATCSLRTVFHAVERLGGIRMGETVVVQGSGPVGLWATAVAARSGASQVIAIGAPKARLHAAEQLGATHVVDVEGLEPSERRRAVQDATEGRGADVVMECSGALSALGEGMELVRVGGRMACIGQSSGAMASVPAAKIVSSQLTLVGVKSGDISHYHEAFRFLGSYAADLDPAILLGSSYELNDVGTALEAVRNMEQLKPVITP